ncbi:UNVERIFIED_CONTAM: hypothetical protein Scaly_2551600 [Sesamum calycinum]|uniref:Reverse transcriptase domain-containing protein n=1 Tax=Sesamum calycinum TaxID=2727403 RepID=A0AAW2IYV1_9LAMI
MEVYVDDMLVKSKETRNHLEDLEETVAMLRNYRLKLNPGKCAFGLVEDVSWDLYLPNESIHFKIRRKRPTILQNTKKVKHFEWTEECQRALGELKAYLAKLPLLVKAIPGDTIYLYISSTSQTVNSVLVREEDGAQTPIYYVSKVLNGAECRNPSIVKMALALVVTTRKFLPCRGQN